MKKVLSVVMLLGALSFFNLTFAQDVKEKKMSLKDAIVHALKNNLDLQIARYDDKSAIQDLKIARAIFVPEFSTNVQYSNSLTPPDDASDAGKSSITSKTKSLGSSISQLIPTGGEFVFSFNSSDNSNNSARKYAADQISSIMGLSFSQPLLKGFGFTPTKYGIYIGLNNLRASKVELKQNIIDTIYNVEAAYWNLVFAYQSLDAAKMALDRANELLKQNEIKKKVGSIGAIEVLSAKAEVARYEGQVISAEKDIQSSQESFKQLLNMSRDTATITPTDTPEIKPIALDQNAFLKEALEKRPDIISAQIGLENSQLGVKYYKNQALPNLSLKAGYYSYGRDIDETIKNSDGTFSYIKRKIGDAVNRIFDFENKEYSVSLSLAIPIGFKAERAYLAKAKYTLEKSHLSVEKTESTIYSEVKGIIKEIESNRKLVEANKLAMELQGENLKAEEKKLAVGLSTNFQVQSYQQQYASAQNQALYSTIQYAMSLSKLNKILGRTLDEYGIKFEDVENPK